MKVRDGVDGGRVGGKDGFWYFKFLGWVVRVGFRVFVLIIGRVDIGLYFGWCDFV